MSTVEFKIESGIQMPMRKRWSKYSSIRFDEMKVGDSVLLKKCNRKDLDKEYNRVYSSVYKVLRKVDGKFKVSTIEKKDKIEIRLWRVE